MLSLEYFWFSTNVDIKYSKKTILLTERLKKVVKAAYWQFHKHSNSQKKDETFITGSKQNCDVFTAFVEILEYWGNTAGLPRNCLKCISQKTRKDVITVSELQLGQTRAGMSARIWQQEGWQAIKKKTSVWVSIGQENTADAAFTAWVEFKFCSVLFPEQKPSLAHGQQQRAPRKEKLLFWISNNRTYFNIPNIVISNQWGKSVVIIKFVKDSRVEFFWLLKSNELQIKQDSKKV